MKAKKTRKLVLTRKTIANLDNCDMSHALGGETGTCKTECKPTICDPWNCESIIILCTAN